MGLGKYIYKMNYKIFLRNYILMESNPDFMDNTRAVFEEMLKQGINKKYKIIWCVDDKDKFKDIKIKNVKFITRNDKFPNKQIFDYYNLFAKCIVDCNKFIFKRNKDQFRIHLTHGPFFKIAYEYSRGVGNVDYILMLLREQIDTYKEVYNVDETKLFSCNYPRCDYLYRKPLQLFPEIKRTKTIMWMPTYRTHINKNKNKSYFKFGVPCIDSEEELLELNELLKKQDTLLIFKLHPVEDTTGIKNLNLSNIVLLNNDIFVHNHTMIYNYLGGMDALITDYSSIYFDYLTTKKPIGLAIPDREEYHNNTPIYFTDYEKDIIGEYIYTFKDLKKFIKNVSDNKDIKYEARLRALKRYLKYDDDESSKRVVDLIMSNISKGKKYEKK